MTPSVSLKPKVIEENKPREIVKQRIIQHQPIAPILANSTTINEWEEFLSIEDEYNPAVPSKKTNSRKCKSLIWSFKMNMKRSSKNGAKERRKKISESDTNHHRQRSKRAALAVVKISPTKKKVSDLQWLPTELELRSRHQSHFRQSRHQLLMPRFQTSTATALQPLLPKSWQNMASKMVKA